MAKNRKSENLSDTLNLIGLDTKVEGHINTKYDVKISGHLIGNIESDKKIIISDAGTIEGDIKCSTLNVAGSITGLIKVSGNVKLMDTALVNGDIYTKKLEVEEGAEFNGNCIMRMDNPSKQT